MYDRNNGKGSTIALREELLMARRKKVGTFTSPHDQYHDRICIGDQPISDDFTPDWPKVQQMEQTLLQTQDQTLLFWNCIASWPLCILRNSCGRGLIGSWYPVGF